MYMRCIARVWMFGFFLFFVNCSSSFTLLQPATPLPTEKTESTASVKTYRFSIDALPREIVEVSTPVFVRVENTGSEPILLTPMAFSLILPDQRTVSPVFEPRFQSSKAPLPTVKQEAPSIQEPPARVDEQNEPEKEPMSMGGEEKITVLLASESTETSISKGIYLAAGGFSPAIRGGSPVRIAPPQRGPMGGMGSGYRPGPMYSNPRGAPSYRPYGYSGYRGYGRNFGYGYGYSPFYGGFGYGPYGAFGYGPYGGFGIYAPFYSAYGWPYNDYIVYQQGQWIDESMPVEEVMERRSLPALSLEKNQQASGFVFFPNIKAESGTRFTLMWKVLNPQGQVVSEVSTNVVLEEVED